MKSDETLERIVRGLQEAETTDQLLAGLGDVLGLCGLPSAYALAFWDSVDADVVVAHSTFVGVAVGDTISPIASRDTVWRDSKSVESHDASAWLPLFYSGEPFGVLVTYGPLSTREAHMQEFAVDQFAHALMRIQTFEETQRLYDADRAKLSAISEVGEILREADLASLLAKLMEVALSTVSAQVGCLMLERDGALDVEVEWGLDARSVDLLLANQPVSLSETILEKRTALVLDEDEVACAAADSGILGVGNFIAVPLATSERVLGCLIVVTEDRGRPLAVHLELLTTVSGLASNAIENALLQKAALDGEAFATQLRLAGEIQESLLPESPPQIPGVELSGLQIQCDEAGGDYYGFFELPEGRVGICVADATGHGISSAFIITTARAFLRALLALGTPLRDVLAHMNDWLDEDLADDKFTTLFLGAYDPRSGRVQYVSAGHYPAFIYRRASDSFEVLENTGMALGMFPGMVFETAETAPLASGDMLVSASDGIPEASTLSGEPYGHERMCSVLRARRDDMPDEITRGLVDSALRFSDKQDDDITVVCMKITA